MLPLHRSEIAFTLYFLIFSIENDESLPKNGKCAIAEIFMKSIFVLTVNYTGASLIIVLSKKLTISMEQSMPGF